LSALPAAEFARLAPLLQDYPLKVGEVLREPGIPIAHVYFPRSGMISLVVVLASGKSVETAMIGNEGAIGAMSAHTDSRAFSRAIVRLPGTASRVALEKFHAVYRASDAIRNVIARYHVVLLREVQQITACNAVHDIYARLARWLLQSYDHSDGNTLPFTQDFLAQMLGVRRATVTMAARRLQSEGIIDYRHGSIEILNRARLERRACECYRIMRRQAESLTRAD
jgi:CRP-like cAMP-binding protein